MKKGFTLVEMLAVVAILAILAIVALPNIIDIFTRSNEEVMQIQENQVLDSANLYLEDYCRNPIDSDKSASCISSRRVISEGNGETTPDKVYFCIDTIKNAGYIKEDIRFKAGTECDGIVVYDRLGRNYSNGKAYLYCGNADYTTSGYDTYSSAFSECGISF